MNDTLKILDIAWQLPKKAFVEVNEIHKEVMADKNRSFVFQACLDFLMCTIELLDIDTLSVAVNTVCKHNRVYIVQVSTDHTLYYPSQSYLPGKSFFERRYSCSLDTCFPFLVICSDLNESWAAY